MATVRRSEGSIERKLQNISAVLDVLGAQWINGYKPLAHYQDALAAAVERSLGRERREQGLIISRTGATAVHFPEPRNCSVDAP